MIHKRMPGKNIRCLLVLLVAVCGCHSTQNSSPSLVGTWELIAATTTEKDTTFSSFDPTHRMIKIINPTHFAFLNHALTPAKNTVATGFTAGGGTYTLIDSTYTESLDYFSDKAWEGHKFPFTVRLNQDTLVQRGIEKVDTLGIDRVIVETYKRVRN